MASLDSQLAITQARLEDSGNEVSSLGQRLILERNRLTELEAMLAGMRAREYRSDLSSTKSGSQLVIMQERNRILEEQVWISVGELVSSCSFVCTTAAIRIAQSRSKLGSI